MEHYYLLGSVVAMQIWNICILPSKGAGETTWAPSQLI